MSILSKKDTRTILKSLNVPGHRFAPESMQKATPEPEPLSFIDDRDSWTIPVPEKMLQTAHTMGLEIEVRVWRPKKS